MAPLEKEKHTLMLVFVGLLSWAVPGGGYFWLKEIKRGLIVLVTIGLTFCIGLYIGSIGVIDYIGAWPWYIAQVINSPAVLVLGHITAGGGYPVYGRPVEIGQIYTSIAGLLNFLCIVNAVYLAHIRGIKTNGG